MQNNFLPKSYKKMFPFTLATTSYIYPDSIVPNVAALAPFLDEIELVLFESRGEDNFPDQGQLDALMDLSVQNQITYNVHLPVDVFLGHMDAEIRSRGVSILTHVIERTSCLQPSTYTLHFDLGEERNLAAWRKRVAESVGEILKCGIPSKRISVETLGYPFEWVEDIVRRFELSICLDIGHLLIKGYPVADYFNRYLHDTSAIHLHGFQDGIDHQGIDRLPGSCLEPIFVDLKHYRGILSLEVFSVDDLRRSLAVLEEKWPKK